MINTKKSYCVKTIIIYQLDIHFIKLVHVYINNMLFEFNSLEVVHIGSF